MRKLKVYLERSTDDIYDSIASKKSMQYRTILFQPPATLRSMVLSRYSLFKHNRRSLSILIPRTFPTLQKRALRHCYDSGTLGLSELLENIKSSQDVYAREVCAYCGLNTPNTFDHYLPKSKFPEFSVLSLNLIPCCSDCNSLKRDNWIDLATGQLLFVNAYFDDVPKEIFVKAKVSVVRGSPLIELFVKPPRKSSNSIYRTIESHYEKLRVLKRAEEMSHNYVISIYTRHKKSLRQGIRPGDLKQILKIDTQHIEQNYGLNHWKAAVNRAILGCPQFFV
jgi:hypothetical protein